jgi:hypothetical protein
LTFTVTNLEEEAALLNSMLINMTKSIRILKDDSKVFDEILEVGKMSKDMKGI